jgi:hypothetical protein
MKVKHTNQCPICQKELKQDNINPVYGGHPRSQPLIFICCSPLADDPLHYYTHTVMSEAPEWIITQEFSIDLGTKYVLFQNNYDLELSSVRSNKEIDALAIPILLVPDFPQLESLRKKIRLSITFS